MNKQKVKKFRALLLDLSTRLRGDIQSLADQTRTSTGGDSAGNLSNTPLHLADLGTAVYLQELNATLLENEECIRDEVLHALKRIDEGTYGKCENCGRPILEERLELLPYTRYCTVCAQALQAGKEVDNPAIAYSGPSGGALDGTPANRRAVGGKVPGAHGIDPEPEPGDSPTGP